MIPVKKAGLGAVYQRMFRQRMAEQGMVRKDAWILPVHATTLAAVSKALQRPGTRILILEGDDAMTQRIETAKALQGLLAKEFEGKPVEVSLVDGIDPVVQVVLGDHGRLPVAVAVAGDVIIAQAWLWPESMVKDPASFNRQVMLSEKLFGLANISLDRGPDGEVHYVAYGALRAQSTPADIAYEIEALAHSVLDIAETFRSQLEI
jgi:uncharacterized protein YjfI (DUF2170 family)